MLLPGVAFLQEDKYLFSSAMRAQDLIRFTQVDEYRQEESGEYTGLSALGGTGTRQVVCPVPQDTVHALGPNSGSAECQGGDF